MRGRYGIALPAVLYCSLLVGDSGPIDRERAAATRATPSALGDCGPEGRPMTGGLQGQVPAADQASGRSARGYQCNVRLVGQTDVDARGANFQLAWSGDCAYVGLAGQIAQPPVGATEAQQQLAGVAVIDASDPRRPRVVRMVRSSVGQHEHEGLEVNERRGLLVVEVGGASAQWIEIYDISEDCTRPVLRGRYDAGSPIFHGLRVSPDGRTVYASDILSNPVRKVLHVIDISDVERPRLLTTWDPTDAGLPSTGIHDLDISDDGHRLYLGTTPVGVTISGLGIPVRSPGTGPTFVILDSSEIQARKADARMRVVGELDTFPNFGHTIQLARIGGRPHVFTSGEVPFAGAPECPWGWGTLVDLADERRPKPVSEIKLEVNEQRNCGAAGADSAAYSVHYNGVDDPGDTKKVFYTWYSAGLRVFDVRDPARPREIAYYQPPPKQETLFDPIVPPPGAGFDAQNPRWDAATSVVRYRPESGHIWFVSIANGFQVVELTFPRRRASMTARVSGRRRVSGRVRLPADVIGAEGCRGHVVIRAMRGSRALARRTASVRRDCTYRATLARRPRGTRVLARFAGNRFLLPARANARAATA